MGNVISEVLLTAKEQLDEAIERSIEAYNKLTESISNSNLSYLNDKINKNTTDINTQKSRIDAFTSLADGSTTGDAELIDARIVNGTTYENLGSAIRGIASGEAMGEKSIGEINLTQEVQNKLPNGLYNNWGIEYPFKNITRNGTQSDPIHRDLQKGILDVKIINAKKGKQYKISWIGNGTTAFGNPEYAMYLQEFDEGFTNGITIFNKDNANLDAPTNTIETRVVTTDDTDIILVVTIDYSFLTAALNYSMNTSSAIGYSSIIDESCYIYKKEIEDKNKMQLKKEGDNYYIKSKYSDDLNIIFKFGKLGINEILHPLAIYFQKFSTNGFEDLELFQEIATDWISPYNFSAVNNTVNDSTLTTGGNHGTNSGSGFRTAIPEYVECYADGRLITTDGLYKDLESVAFKSKNNIASSNVLNLDTGEGFRGVISEYTTFSIEHNNINAMVQIVANEDVIFKNYACPQLSGLGDIYSSLFFGGDTSANIITDFTVAYNTDTLANGSKVDRAVAESDKGYLTVYKDINVGINDFRYTSTGSPTGQITTAKKVYLKNFNGRQATLSNGDTFYYNCVYSFNKKYECEGSVRAYKVNDIYIADFSEAVNKTYFIVDTEDINKKVEVVENVNVTADSYSTSKGVEINSTGAGYIKFKLVD